jgi:hypothetical protein
VAHGVHIKSKGLGNFEVYMWWPSEFLINFRIIQFQDDLGNHARSWRHQDFEKLSYMQHCTGLMYMKYNPVDSEGIFSSTCLMYPLILVMNRYSSLLSLCVQHGNHYDGYFYNSIGYELNRNTCWVHPQLLVEYL